MCPTDNEKVERDEMVKGYEFSKDRYVTFTEEELKALEEKATKAIEITEFVPLSKIDPVYFDKAYYLGPDRGGERAYRLLSEAMERTGRAALAKYAARGKQYLVMLRPLDGGVVMQQLLYADEVRPFSEIELEDLEVKESELNLAVQLVQQISTDSFKPETYEDDVKKRIHEQIQRKVEGQDISTTPVEEPKGQIIDLMEALKASLGKAKTSAIKEDKETPAGEERKPTKKVPRRSAEEHSKASKK